MAQEPSTVGEAAEGIVDRASKGTTLAEQAFAVLDDLMAGRMDLRDVPGRVDLVLEMLERLDERDRWEKVRRPVRALSGALALLFRWADLVRLLKRVHAAGERFGDMDTVAWSEHELGTLHLAAGDLAGANRRLEEAARLRRDIEDWAGLRATEQNLQVLCRQLREELREGDTPPGRGRRVALLAAVAVLFLLIGGVAGAMLDSDDPPDRGDPPAGDDRGGLETEETQPGTATLRIEPPLGGTVTSDPEGIACPQVCERTFASGTDVTLTALPAKGLAFGEWSGDCTGSGDCLATMTADRQVAATFVRTGPTTVEVTVTVTGSGTVTDGQGNFDCSETCSASFKVGEQIVLTATGDLIEWQGDCVPEGSSCTLTPEVNASVTAAFEEAQVGGVP